MAGLTGSSTFGVGSDIISYLKEVAKYFSATIHVTSGHRSADSQANAMFDNWEALDRGKVYKKSTLPETDRAKLDEFYETIHDHKAKSKAREEARAEFMKLAKEKVGSKSLHTRGRAIDVRRHGINAKVHKAIVLYLHDVPEGTRTDIYHFESVSTVPKVDDKIKAKWQAIKDGKPHTHHPPIKPHSVGC